MSDENSAQRPRRKMGEPDATGECRHCGKDIDRQWWGNGGWIWIHRDTNERTECYPVTHAEPVMQTVKELFPNG